MAMQFDIRKALLLHSTEQYPSNRADASEHDPRCAGEHTWPCWFPRSESGARPGRQGGHRYESRARELEDLATRYGQSGVHAGASPGHGVSSGTGAGRAQALSRARRPQRVGPGTPSRPAAWPCAPTTFSTTSSRRSSSGLDSSAPCAAASSIC
jgi:hypothetical protein